MKYSVLSKKNFKSFFVILITGMDGEDCHVLRFLRQSRSKLLCCRALQLAPGIPSDVTGHPSLQFNHHGKIVSIHAFTFPTLLVVVHPTFVEQILILLCSAARCRVSVRIWRTRTRNTSIVTECLGAGTSLSVRKGQLYSNTGVCTKTSRSVCLPTYI